MDSGRDRGKRYSERLPRCFSGGETLRRGYTVIRRECGQTLGRVRVRTVVIISLQRTKG